jgi:hypothetical protein
MDRDFVLESTVASEFFKSQTMGFQIPGHKYRLIF